jgi:hypothetical protein
MQSTPFKNNDVAFVFQSYPKKFRDKLLILRELIFKTAREINREELIEETLKWGEPSYIAKKGSTIRINWKEQLNNEYAIYFKCTSLLVPTFKQLYPTLFKYEKNRGIHFTLDDKIPIKELTHCIEMALTYHQIKNSLKEIKK